MFKYLLKRKNALAFAFKGIAAFSNEPHAKVHYTAGATALIAAYLLQFTLVEWCIVLLCIALVLFAEAVNSAIERLVNKVSPEWNNEAGLVKDISAGAVLLACIFVGAVGLLLFIPKLIRLF